MTRPARSLIAASSSASLRNIARCSGSEVLCAMTSPCVHEHMQRRCQQSYLGGGGVQDGLCWGQGVHTWGGGRLNLGAAPALARYTCSRLGGRGCVLGLHWGGLCLHACMGEKVDHSQAEVIAASMFPLRHPGHRVGPTWSARLQLAVSAPWSPPRWQVGGRG